MGTQPGLRHATKAKATPMGRLPRHACYQGLGSPRACSQGQRNPNRHAAEVMACGSPNGHAAKAKARRHGYAPKAKACNGQGQGTPWARFID